MMNRSQQRKSKKVNSQSLGDVRRIQLTGRGSYVISIPKNWVDDLQLAKGEQINMVRQGNSLILTPLTLSKRKETTEIEFTMSSEDADSVLRKLVSLYLVGYNIIRIRSKENRPILRLRDTIREFARNNFVGTEVITESSEEIVLQVLLSYPELSVENVLRRMITIASSMHKDAILSLGEGRKDLAQEVIKLDSEVDRFSFYVIRQLKLAVTHQDIIEDIGLKSPRDCLGFRLIVKSVERIADHAARIAENTLEMSDKVDSRLFEAMSKMSDLVNDLFERACAALFNRDYISAEKVLRNEVKMEASETNLIRRILHQTSDVADASRLRLILESLRRIGEYSADIAEVVLNLTVTKAYSSQPNVK